jgi:hypothetical protein
MTTAPRRAFARLAQSAAALALTAGAARAQAPINPFSFGVSAGAAVPTGRSADAYDLGYSVDGIISLRAPTLPVSFRGEFGYTRFGVKNLPNNLDGNTRILSGVANVVLPFPAGPTAVVRPYVIGGVGAYNLRGSASTSTVTARGDSETRLGVNGGAGIEIPLSGITGFGEVRFTSIIAKGGNVNFVPIRFGIRF